MKHKSRDYKISAVKYYLKSLNYTETATIFGCSRQSLTRWAKQFEKGKDIKQKIKKNISYKITKKHIFFIKHTLEKNKQITINRLHQNLIKKFLNLKISLSHLYRIVKDINYSLKEVKFQHIPKTRYGKKINIKESKKKFYDYLYKKQPEDIICIDETSLKSFTVRKKGRSRIGIRCVVKTTNQQVFEKYTGIFAMSSSKIIGYKIYTEGGINSERLLKFLQKNFQNVKNKIIILDNASSHRNKKVKDFITKNNFLLYTVPYQPRTQAIEGFFNLLKSKLSNKKDLGYEKLYQNVENILKEIPEEIYYNLIFGAYFKPQKKRKINTKKEKNYKN